MHLEHGSGIAGALPLALLFQGVSVSVAQRDQGALTLCLGLCKRGFLRGFACLFSRLTRRFLGLEVFAKVL
ncbi:hypothetical protein [Lamprobacter modestohalophilus]|uniref:hypothetical protein n=1 Tax=Lamprobacter modestohalophilus TaxID=1064514 RepID=UPI0019064158|nr:hypothetical protein [Lamprobacter modestohalophilus]